MTAAGRVDRLRDDLRRRMAGPMDGRMGARVSAVVGLDELDALESTVVSLEVAVAENVRLEGPLTAVVDALERDVMEVLSRRAGTGMGA